MAIAMKVKDRSLERLNLVFAFDLENLDPTLLVWLLGLGYSFVSCTIGPRFLASKMRRIVAEVYHSEPAFRFISHRSSRPSSSSS
ncbi:hypothetical protein HO173_007348 [Letharia columbiana]|uniref:Uncharacterized protein n=1 Tax=Letharia columbiana TaxID=112416 RepID=A0A8H6FT70_9LECA|nr:uncharacterized protein HO173_007348 [Letharia columbiana]KAF6234315.1 hypothetical protein HO173_007348 [Letharia columbiana]